MLKFRPAVCGLLMAGACTSATQSVGSPTAPIGATAPCVISRIIDGDTVHCNEVGTIRLIGINSPERNQPPNGLDAAEALAMLAPLGDTVLVEVDRAERDRFGRILGYLWRRGELINVRMVSDGWATVEITRPNDRYADALRTAQREARAARKGRWAAN